MAIKTKLRTAAQQAAIDRQLAIEKREMAKTAATSGMANIDNSKKEGLAKESATSSISSVVPSVKETTSKTAAAGAIAGLNTNGLLEADARRRAGTANAADLANLKNAESQGWSAAPSSTPQQVAPTNPVQSGTGATNANTAGLAEAAARRRAGTANETDLRNLEYAEKNGIWSETSDPTNVSSLQEANDFINSEQDADIAALSGSDEPQTRKTVSDYMAEIKSAITPTSTPEAPNYEQSLEGLRLEYGVNEAETYLNDLQTEKQDLINAYNTQFGKERAKTVAMGVIGGRISEEERQMNERIAALDSRINAATNQVNTKYNVINSIMEAKTMDYQAASTSYQNELTQNLNLFNMAQGIEQSVKTEAQQIEDTARANAQIMISSLAATGQTFSSLTPSAQAQLVKLGTESGLGGDFFQTMFNTVASAGKETLTHVISDDKSFATIIYKDGTTAVIPTGLPASSNVPVGGSGGSAKQTDEEKAIESFRKDVAEEIKNLENDQYYTWGAAWDSLRVRYPDASPELIDEMLGGGYDTESGLYVGRANR